MLALEYTRSVPAYALVKATGGRASAATGPLSMIHLGEVPEPRLPAPSWVHVYPRLAGICGSDLSAIQGHASLYLDPLTSYPFVPGHEMVAQTDDGARVVLQPALGCVVRGIDPICRQCAAGKPGLCENATEGDLATGLQTGYCQSTGGGWGEVVAAHPSQLFEVPDSMSDEVAVLIEPFACCIHAALRGGVTREDVVVVFGAGTIGLLTIAALRAFTPPRQLIAVAKHPHQRELAKRLGADTVVAPADVFKRVRFATGARRLDGSRDAFGLSGPGRPLLLGGADVIFECVGSGASLNDSVRLARAGGRIIAVGMPGEETVDWAPIWQRELTVMGAYAYGVEANGRSTFEMALEAAAELPLEGLCGPLFALSEYREAIEYAAAAGSLNAVKVAFDLRGLRA